MEIKRFEGTGRMSRAVVHNNTVYLCGQTHGDENADIKEQTRVCLEKVEDLLNKYGSDKRHILSTTIYVKDMADFAGMNEVFKTYFTEDPPCRVTVGVTLPLPELLIEIDAIAVPSS